MGINRHRFSGILVIIILLSSCSLITLGQESAKEKQENFWKRVSVGGYLSLQIGNVTGIVISPEASVRLVDQLYGGLGFSYQYYWYKNYYWDKNNPSLKYNYSSSVYGGRIFLRYYLRSIFDNFLGNLFAHAEYEYLYYTIPYVVDPYGKITDGFQTYSKGRQGIDINSIFVGGGYAQPLGSRAYLDIMVLFNLNDTYNSPYTNPVFRIGFGVGL
jgi:hypothetical protein